MLPEIIPSTETGKLQVMHLKRYWNKSLLKRNGQLSAGSLQEEFTIDTTLLSILGLGLEQTSIYVYQTAPTFDEFENWILEVAGMPGEEKRKQFNQIFSGGNSVVKTESQPDVLTKEDWDFWNQNGYIIIRNAVSKVDCDNTIEALCSFIEIDRYDPATWYNSNPARQGIMVQMFQHPTIEQNRRAPRIRKAYEELWNRTDIWVNADRVGFNPPETATYLFTGPRLHFDVSIKQPMPFGLQGLLYLSDTAENQGAFTLVPGFHNRIGEWMNSLPEGVNPRTEDLYAFGPKPIAANAGDFIIWNNALPHGSSPNTSTAPRFVQYMTFAPIDEEKQEVWI
jgi:hypothetical protein